MNISSMKSHKIKTIFRFSIPSIIAMVLTSLISVVDGFFIGNYVGTDGIAAVNLGLPIIYLYLAVGLMISVGGVAIAGIALGEGDHKKCSNVFNQTLCTTAVVSWILSLLMWLCFDSILHILKTDTQVSAYFKDYYFIMLFELPIMVINTSFGMFIRSEGSPQYFMNVNILNILLNILLDYLFVQWFGLGVKGIAAASLISAIAALLCILYFFVKISKVYTFHKFTFSAEVVITTLFNGSSEFIGEMSLSISMFAYNFIIMRHIGVDGVTAFAIVGYISYIFSMIILGFGQGATALISFTYGAKEYELTSDLRRITNRLVFLVGAGVLLLVLCASQWYSNLFVENKVVQQMIYSGAKIFAVCFLFSGVNTITSFYFTATGRAFESAIISFSRGLVILLICIFTLPPVLGMLGVWLVAPITEALTLLLSLLFLCKENKTMYHKLIQE